MEALSNHLGNTSEEADFSRVRGNLPILKVTLGAVITALSGSLAGKNEEIRPVVFGLLGRIVSFSGLSANAELRRAIEPALPLLLNGLEDSDAAVRVNVLARLDAIPIRQAEIVAALKRFIERSDRPAEEHQTALLALKVLTDPAGSKTAKGSGPGPGRGRLRLRND